MSTGAEVVAAAYALSLLVLLVVLVRAGLRAARTVREVEALTRTAVAPLSAGDDAAPAPVVTAGATTTAPRAP